jgi:hypothetical protein
MTDLGVVGFDDVQRRFTQYAPSSTPLHVHVARVGRENRAAKAERAKEEKKWRRRGGREKNKERGRRKRT